MIKPYKAEDFNASELVEVIADACNCAYADGYEQGRTDAIEECLQIVRKIKYDYNDSKFEKQVAINYGTICGIIIAMEQLKKQNIK